MSGDAVAVVERFPTAGCVPDRVLGPVLRTTAVGDVVVREQHRTATLAGFGLAGDRIDDGLCSVSTVRDGLITEHDDCG